MLCNSFSWNSLTKIFKKLYPNTEPSLSKYSSVLLLVRCFLKMCTLFLFPYINGLKKTNFPSMHKWAWHVFILSHGTTMVKANIHFNYFLHSFNDFSPLQQTNSLNIQQPFQRPPKTSREKVCFPVYKSFALG